MKVLVADKFEQSGIDGLEAAGCEVVYRPDLKDDALTAAVRDTGADVLVVRSTAVNRAALEAGSLSLVVRAGAGYNTIDVATASQRGIYVSNCPGKNAIAVAELAFALILAIDRRVPDNAAELRAGTWNKKEYSKARGLFGRTIGLLGYGNIGQEVARRAHAFGMPIVVWSRRFATGGANAADEPVPMQVAKTPQAAAERCDILSVHLALTSDTRGPHAGDAHARRPPPRSARRPRARVRSPPQRQHQRAGDGECDLRRRGSGRRAHQRRRRAVGRFDEDNQAGKRRHPRLTSGEDM